MLPPHVVAVTGIIKRHRKSPLVPLNSALKTGVEAMLGASLLTLINCTRWLLRDVMLCLVGGDVHFHLNFCLIFWDISFFGATSMVALVVCDQRGYFTFKDKMT